MTLQEAIELPGLAIHTSGRYLLDRKVVPRRFIFVDYIDPEGPGGWNNPENFTAVRFASVPADFPSEGWIGVDET